MRPIIIAVLAILAACCGEYYEVDAGNDTDNDAGLLPDGGAADYWTCDVCNGLSQPSSSDCGAITFEGCCDQAGRVIYCQSGSLYCIDCATLDPSCGWSDVLGAYDCGTEGDPEPSDTYPMECS